MRGSKEGIPTSPADVFKDRHNIDKREWSGQVPDPIGPSIVLYREAGVNGRVCLHPPTSNRLKSDA